MGWWAARWWPPPQHSHLPHSCALVSLNDFDWICDVTRLLGYQIAQALFYLTLMMLIIGAAKNFTVEARQMTRREALEKRHRRVRSTVSLI